jgi:hypothetical protein
MKTRSGFVSNSSSSSFVVFATKKDIEQALSEITDSKFRKWIREEFVSYGDKVRFNKKEYIRKVGMWTNENWPIDEDNNVSEEDCWAIAKQFFGRIGPVSKIEEY